MALADDGEVLGRDAELAGEILHGAMLDVLLLQILQKLVEEFDGAGVQIVCRHILEQQIAHCQQGALEQRLHYLAAIGLPRGALAEGGVEAEAHQFGELGVELHIHLVHLQYQHLAHIHGAVPHRDMRLKDAEQSMVAYAHCRARKIVRHLLDVEYGIRGTDKDVAPFYREFPPVEFSLQASPVARCNHVHLKPHRVGVLQHLDIVDNQDILVEIAGTDLGTLRKLTFLDALLHVLLFFH